MESPIKKVHNYNLMVYISKDNFFKETITVVLFVVAIWSFEACSESSQTSEMELSMENICRFKANGIFVKIPTSDNRLGFLAHLWLGSCSLSLDNQIWKIKNIKFLVEA